MSVVLQTVRKKINLSGFQVFEAVFRHKSITRASEELGITQSAASHQVRKLAERLGEDLVRRNGRQIILTKAGTQLGKSLRSAFDIIDQEVAAMEGDRSIVQAGVYSSFGMSWLIPRLPRFQIAHPEVDLRLIMLHDPHEVSSRVADVFVTSEVVRSGYMARRLFAEQLVPVVRADRTADFAAPMRLISSEAEPGIAGRAWEAFAALNGMDASSVRSGEWVCCSHYIFALEMALAGMGAALLPDFVAAQEISAGRLQRMPGQALPTGQIYELHVPLNRRRDPPIVSFTSWLQDEVSNAPCMS